MDQYIGKLLDNRYEILEVIGTGGMAKVYKARCHRLNRLVAIKILRDDLAQDAEFRRRFHDESQAVAMLSHPNIVAVYDVSRGTEMEYIVMELIDGITLKQYMQKKGNKLNWREALHFITQIVKALGHAHSRGIIHRDIKPHNVMVLRDGSVRVADFGIARVSSGGHSTLTQEALGSVHYISPEQARGSHIDARSDLYSAGVVLYEMITGRLPFEGDTAVSVAIQHINSIPLSPRELDDTLPEALEAITMKAMAPNPDNRYLNADEMLADLEEFRKNPAINFDYSISDFMPEEEPGDDKTQVRPVVPSRVADSPRSRRTAERRADDYEDDYDRGSSPWVIVACVAAVLLFVAGVLYFLLSTFFSDIFAPAETYQVPNLVGKYYEEVVDDQQLLLDHFTVVLQETVENKAEAGTIIKQDLTANSNVGPAVTEIKVTVSAGPEVIYMIDLANKEYREAYLAMNKAKIKYKDPTYAYHDEVPADHVISFLPLVDSPMAPDTQVEWVVSLGPEPKMVTVSSLINRTKEQAMSDIRTMNLEVGEVEEVYDDTVEAGRVVGQYPTAATEVAEGTKVNLQISKGPDPSTLKPQEVTKDITVSLPDAADTINVQVLMDDELVYSGDVDTAMEASVTFTVTSTGTHMFTVYVDGALYSSFTKEFV